MAARSKEIKKAQYYVWYLGWRECHGLRGREHADPVIREIIHNVHSDPQPFTKLTVQVNKKEVKITQEFDRKKGKPEKAKLPNIPSRDVTYACQAAKPDDDTVGVIYLGFNPKTNYPIHLHAYRCDSPETAAMMASHFQGLADLPEHRDRMIDIERELVETNQISYYQPPRHHSNGSGSGSSGSATENREIPIGGVAPFSNVTVELREKLRANKAAGPILLPPCDYDTISRAQGCVALRGKRPSLQHDSLAPGGALIRRSGGDDVDYEPEQITMRPQSRVPPGATRQVISEHQHYSPASSQGSDSEYLRGLPRYSSEGYNQQPSRGTPVSPSPRGMLPRYDLSKSLHEEDLHTLQNQNRQKRGSSQTGTSTGQNHLVRANSYDH